MGQGIVVIFRVFKHGMLHARTCRGKFDSQSKKIKHEKPTEAWVFCLRRKS